MLVSEVERSICLLFMSFVAFSTTFFMLTCSKLRVFVFVWFSTWSEPRKKHCRPREHLPPIPISTFFYCGIWWNGSVSPFSSSSSLHCVLLRWGFQIWYFCVVDIFSRTRSEILSGFDILSWICLGKIKFEDSCKMKFPIRPILSRILTKIQRKSITTCGV